jgi:hypothetical protein
MATISEGADVHTLIVMFTVEPSQQDSLVEHLRGIVAEHSRLRLVLHSPQRGRYARRGVHPMALGGAPGSRPEHPGGTSSTRGVVANRRRARCESACLPGGVGNPGRPVCLAITTSIRVAATTCTRSECSSTSWPRSAPSKPCGSVNAVRGGVDHSIPHLMCRKLQQNCAGPIARFGPAPNAWAGLQVGPPVGAAKSATSGSTGRNGVQSLQT